MCGIVGYVGPKDCSEVLVNALTKLEYRGYDSAGTSRQVLRFLITEKSRP